MIFPNFAEAYGEKQMQTDADVYCGFAVCSRESVNPNLLQMKRFIRGIMHVATRRWDNVLNEARKIDVSLAFAWQLCDP